MNERKAHPRDRLITVFGRKPVLEVMLDADLDVRKLFLAHDAKGPLIHKVLEAAKQRQISVERCSSRQVSRISRNGRQDQGVAADIRANHMCTLESWLSSVSDDAWVFVVDGITTPGNVGMLIRSLTAAGCDGLVLPRVGAPSLSPLVIKASAGVAFRAPILRCSTAAEGAAQLRSAGFTLYGLSGTSTESFYELKPQRRSAWVLGNETTGVSDEVARFVSLWCNIPMHHGVESLNVSHAGAIVGFELARRQRSKIAPTGA